MAEAAVAQRSSDTVGADPMFGVDALLTAEEREIRDTVRSVVQRRISPYIAGWYESGELPARELAGELGELGLLGMHLQGYGCAGTSAVAYGSGLPGAGGR